MTYNVVLAVDGRNFNAATRRVGMQPDYERIKRWAGQRKGPDAAVNARYYTTVVPGSNTGAALQPLLARLAHLGYVVTTRSLRPEGDHAGRIKGSCDVELTVDAMHALADGADELVLASGDADFAPLLQYCRAHGVRTAVLSTLVGEPAIASGKLLEYADEFIELDSVRDLISRKVHGRVA